MIFQSNLLLRILQISLFFCLHLFLVHSIILDVVGMWHSLVARIVRDDEAAGSNSVIPTIEITSRQLWLAAFFVRRFLFTSHKGKGDDFRLRRSVKMASSILLFS